MVSILKDTANFTFIGLVLFYIPGYLLTGMLKREWKIFDRLILSGAVGIFTIPQLYFYFLSINVHRIFIIFIILLSTGYCVYRIALFIRSYWKIKKITNFAFNPTYVLLSVLGFVVIIISLLIIGTSGLVYDDGMRFYQANAYDSVAQLAMTQELAKDGPYEFPFYAGLPLKGYHVGAFYWRALIQKLTAIDALDLFFRYCPMFLFALIIMMTFISVRNITENNYIAVTAVFFIFLMSDLSWLFPILDRLLPLHNIQTIDFRGSLLRWAMFNPPFAHGILIFFMGCYFLKYCISEKGQNNLWLPILLTSMLFGSLYEYKAFMWAVIVPSILLVAIKEYFFNKETLFLKIAIVTIIFSIFPIFRTSSGQDSLSLFKFNVGYYPLSIFREMGILTSDAKANFFIVILAFLFFLMGGLGIKAIGFYKICRYIIGRKRIPSIILFLIFSIIFSFMFTNGFMLGSNYPRATYNFYTIFLIVFSLFAASALFDLTNNSRVFVKLTIFLTVFIIGIGSTAFSFLGYFPKYSKYKVISKGEIEAVDYLKINSPEDAVILHNTPTKCWISEESHQKLKEDTEGRDAFISALTGRRAVLDCSWHMAIGRYAPDIEARQADINLFFKTEDEKAASNILNKYNVSYVWVEKGRNLYFQEKDTLEEVFSNNAATIYKVL